MKSLATFWYLFLKLWVSSGAKVCKSCRSWKMLKNDYLLAKIGVDTAENELFQVVPNGTAWRSRCDLQATDPRSSRRAAAPCRPPCRSPSPRAPPRHITLSQARSRLYQRRSLQVNSHFSAFFKICKIFTLLHRSELNFWRKLSKIFRIFSKFSKNFEFFLKFLKFCKFFFKIPVIWAKFWNMLRFERRRIVKIL